MAKKLAMVKPAPRFPSGKPVIPEIAAILKLLGNDRAYTIIKKSGNTWIIHFEGDTKHKTITIEGEKPEII